MDQGLVRLISDYQASVSAAVELMRKSGIERPLTSTDWAVNGIPQRGELVGGVSYFKHGFGCAVELPTGKIDFDFGDAGQIDGFDAWRLARFAENRLPDYGFESETALRDCFNAEASAGALRHSGYLLITFRLRTFLPSSRKPCPAAPPVSVRSPAPASPASSPTRVRCN